MYGFVNKHLKSTGVSIKGFDNVNLNTNTQIYIRLFNIF